jgi:hypothetical protein
LHRRSSPDVTLDGGLRERYSLFCLSGNANLLVMPSLDAANHHEEGVSVETGAGLRPGADRALDIPVSDRMVFAYLAGTSME